MQGCYHQLIGVHAECVLVICHHYLALHFKRNCLNRRLGRRRNELVALNMVVGVATASLTVIASVASLFGMNLYPLPIEHTSHYFMAVVISTCGVALLVFLSIIGYARWKRLLFVASPSGLGGPHRPDPNFVPIVNK